MRAISTAAAVAVLALTAAAAPTHATVRPSLRVVSTEPLVVRGTSFRPGERVSLTAMTLLGPRRTVVRATATGRIAATFRLPGQPCGSAFTLRALGALGSRATLHLPSRPCIPPPIR